MIRQRCNICGSSVLDHSGFGIYWVYQDRVYYQLLFDEDAGDLHFTVASDSDCKVHICKECMKAIANKYNEEHLIPIIL